MLCVIATSFAFLDTTLISVKAQMDDGLSFDQAYGNLLGCFLVGAILQSGVSFIPAPFMRRIFPQWLAGLAVFLIGVSLTR
jgi:xanthine/uracil permease